jgi:chromosomal replication initiator protein
MLFRSADKCELIIRTVCEHFGVPYEKLLKRNRERRYCLPRQICMYLMRRYTSQSWKDIGDCFSMDHTTAIHSHRLIGNMLETGDYPTKSAITAIDKRL